MSRRGESFIELLVALVILELAGAMALAVAFTVERLGRHAAAGAAEDVTRWHDYRMAEIQPTCARAAMPDTVPLTFLPTPDRPALTAVVRCGR